MSLKQVMPALYTESCKELQVSVITTKRAYEELEREALLKQFMEKSLWLLTTRKC